MREYDDAVLECFLDKQLQLFPEAVAETLDEAEDFLEECMAVVVDSVRMSLSILMRPAWMWTALWMMRFWRQMKYSISETADI